MADGQPKLTTTLRSALAWAFAMNWGQRAVTSVSTLIIAGILGPADFGLVAMALVYIGFAQVLLEQGISTAVVQRTRLDAKHLDSAFWLTVIWCLALAGASVGLSHWWAAANRTPELERVIQVLSLLLLLQGLTVVQQAILQREMSFRKLAVRSNVAALVGAGVGIGLATADYGVWALVAQELAFAGTAVLLLWTVSSWRPHLSFSRSHARDLLGFSTLVFLGNVGSFVSRRSDALVIGLVLGPTVVGLYRFADRLIESLLAITTRPVQMVSLPHFSRLKDNRDALTAAAVSCIRVTTLATWPLMLIVAACSDELVGVLGQQWSAAVDAIRLLAVVGMAKAVIVFVGPLLFAVGRPGARMAMIWFFAGLGAAAFAIVAIALEGSTAGELLLGLAGSRAALFALLFAPVALALAMREAGLRVRALLPALPGPLFAGLAGFLAATALDASGALGTVGPAVALLASLAAGVIAAILILLLIERPLRVKSASAMRRLSSLPKRSMQRSA